METAVLQTLIDTAAGRIPAELLLRHGSIADVYTGRFIEGELAVAAGRIAAIGKPGQYRGRTVVDAAGQYILPGFIDSHMHIESTFLSPPELGRLLVPHGTAAIISDPHEVVNVCGLAGLDYMLAASGDIPLDIKFMAPSCVPVTPFESTGARLDAAALAAPLSHERILGLGEMMDYPAVINAESAVLDKLARALRLGKIIDGHSPGLSGMNLAAYMAGMIHTDHECSTIAEMRERLEAGMYVMLRQGSACRDLRNLLPGITGLNSRRCLLCSDDLQPRTIFEAGHLDNSLRICVQAGVDPMTALRMATLNAAECYRLIDRGGFAPGLRADIVMVDNLRDFQVRRVFIQGKPVAEQGRYTAGPVPRIDDSALRRSFHVKDFAQQRLALRLSGGSVWVIDVQGGSVVTGKGAAEVRRDESGFFVYESANGTADGTAESIAKIAVVERHQNTGNIGIALIRGYGIRRGAIAISVAHDSHNIIAVGTNDADMAKAIRRLIALEGGAVLAADGAVIEEMPLPLAGLMSDRDGVWVDQKLRSIQTQAAETLGVRPGIDPLMTLCFMSLPVIPALKITSRGLFDSASFGCIPVERSSGPVTC